MGNKKSLGKLFLIIAFGVFIKAEAQSSALAIADSLYTMGDYTKAIKKYMEVNPKEQYTLLQIAKAYRAKGTYTDALSYYEKAISSNPDLTSVKLEYATLLMTTRKFQKADSVYAELTTSNPENPNFQYRLGLAKKNLRDSTAIHYFKEAFRLDSTHQKSCFEVAKHYLKKRNYDMVWETANIGLHSYSENVELISVLGQSFLLKEDYYTALPYFEKLLELNQENEFVHSKLALCYSNDYQFKKAIIHYEEALKYDNKIPARYVMLGNCYSRLNKYDKAIEYYKVALVLKDIPFEEELLAIAMAHRHKEDWKEAIKYAKLSLKENPNFERAQYQLATFADAYYKDPKVKLEYYNLYLKKFENDKKKKYLVHITKKRVAQLKKEIEEKTQGEK